MEYHILAVGDVVMEPGLRHLERHLRPLKKLKNIAFTVVNGENAAGSDNSAIELTCEELERCASNFVEWVDVCKGWRPEEQQA